MATNATHASSATQAAQHELHFPSLFQPGRGVVVPCDAAGHVDIDGLTERQKLSYLAARAMIGREYAYPSVRRTH